ncbi:hypothetical protein [Caudoviricetes sp.]|nr:hypothetical protein [Caudoviricetes sp.]
MCEPILKYSGWLLLWLFLRIRAPSRKQNTLLLVQDE